MEQVQRFIAVSARIFLTHQDSSFFYVHLIHIRSWYSSTQLEERTKNHQNSYRQGNILLLFIKARWKFKIIIIVSRIQCSWNQNNINELLSFSTKFVVFLPRPKSPLLTREREGRWEDLSGYFNHEKRGGGGGGERPNFWYFSPKKKKQK